MSKIITVIPKFAACKKEKTQLIRLSKSILFGITAIVLGQNVANAQLTATGQIRERTEARGGQGTLLQNGKKGALFNSQRTRLNVGFAGYRYKIFASLQDVRVWGQDASTINRTTTDSNDGILFHEAWSEISLVDTLSTIQNLSVKIGRQEISYDDQKVMGSLDWLQQARRHDAILIKYANKGWTADLGFAFNQRSEQLSGTLYNGQPGTYPAGTNAIGHAYKSFQYAYVAKKFYFGDMSFLFFKDDFSKFTGTVAAPTIIEGVNSRTTTGIYYNINPTRKFNLNGSFYHQGGKDKLGKTISANLASATATYQVGRKLFLGVGADYLSGTDENKEATQNNLFDPLYGTPHKFWGYMDYFYVASGFGEQGLFNYFVKAKYNANDNLSLFLDVHGFESAAEFSNGQDQYLGTEIDFRANYKFTKIINIEGGYSYMGATRTMASAAVKNVANPNLAAHWAYLMLNITPNFLNTKKM